MKTVRSRTLPLLALAVALAACDPTYYAPTTHNVPLLRDRGEVQGVVSFDGSRIEVQGAWAATDHLMVTGGRMGVNPSDLDNGDGGSGHLLEGGVGYFNHNGTVGFEVQGLVGFGQFRNYFPSKGYGSASNIEGRLLRLGIQPAVGFRLGPVHTALSTRLAQINYSGLKVGLDPFALEQAALLGEKPSYLLFEPAATVRVGVEQVMVQMQLGLSANLTDSDFSQESALLTLGVVFRLPGEGSRP